MKTVSLEFAKELIDFAPTAKTREMGFGESQLQGAVAAYNMLARNSVAYLADEVGMGKTYVALGVLGLLRHLSPAARVMVVAPRENIQRKWVKELTNFVRSNWKVEDNSVKGLDGRPARQAMVCNSLTDLADVSRLNDDHDLFMRATSFSASVRDSEAQNRLRKPLLKRLPWIPRNTLRLGHKEDFRDRYGRVLNAIVPDIDLLIVDEAHGLKHGFDPRGSNRNRVMGLAFGHPGEMNDEYPWYTRRVSRVLLLSATPFEYDYRDVYNQLDVLGFGNTRLVDGYGGSAVAVKRLVDSEADEEEKRDVLRRMLLRRVGYLKIADQRYSKNMYRREWRQGGYETPAKPMCLDDPKERLVVGLIQKKVAEVLGDKRFNNSFQIGMLSSFESFLETMSRGRRRTAPDAHEEGVEEGRIFDGDQEATNSERGGVDTKSLAQVVKSYRKEFGRPLPHPKLDATAKALASAFETGEKALVFVRRVATVAELKAKLDATFDGWIECKIRAALPGLSHEIDRIFRRYRRERAGISVDVPEDSSHSAVDQVEEDHPGAVTEDEGGLDTFFAWFFRGAGPRHVLSGAAFQKNRLASMASVYSTLFEDDHVSWLLGRPANVVDALAGTLGRDRASLDQRLKSRAFRYYRARSQQQSGYPRFYVVESYQAAALGLLREHGGDLGSRAEIVLQERYRAESGEESEPPARFPAPSAGIGIITFFTELVRRPALREALWPDDNEPDFRDRFRQRERRRELLSAMARLGAAYIDLYLTAIRQLGSFEARSESDAEQPEKVLVSEFVDLLERQSHEQGFHAFSELSGTAAAFETIMAVNFPEAHNAPLASLAEMYGRTLQHQMPVGGMSGGVNKRMVQQFRMPGFPLVLATTEVLQEGEDLHTFCRRVIHYGITWTPSAMEQRTGRIDRIGSLAQRELDGRGHPPEDGEFIQVYYPHLRDTVEVFQVRRVLERLNKFLRMTHRGEKHRERGESRINVSEEALRRLDQVSPIEGLLESAFPVPKPWLTGTAVPADVRRMDTETLERSFQECWRRFADRWELEPRRTVTARRVEGTFSIQHGKCVRPSQIDPSAPVRRQPFTLELCSHRAGGATLVECLSPIGRIALDDSAELDRLYELQRKLVMVKICAEHDLKTRQYDVSVRGDRMFHLDTTQPEEIEHLIIQTVEAADSIEAEMIEDDQDPNVWIHQHKQVHDAED